MAVDWVAESVLGVSLCAGTSPASWYWGEGNSGLVRGVGVWCGVCVLAGMSSIAWEPGS